MPQFEIRVLQTETIVVEGFITVSAKSLEAAKIKAEKMIDAGKIYNDGDWEQISTMVDIEVD